jgi:glycosyltransferase involved in cell wall biosynthesis
VEHIVIDGGSRDDSLRILQRYRGGIAHLVSEPDRGAASAINKGLRLSTGEVIGWLNSDDRYRLGALGRVAAVMQAKPRKALCFGHCPIIDETGTEIRKPITRFKELFFPFSCRSMIQSINYISQPAMFFRRTALAAAGPLREEFRYAWDYEFVLRLWKQGGAVHVPGGALSEFRWHPGSLSGQGFVAQFQEELDAALADAGRFSVQGALHRAVRWGIVTIYSRMTKPVSSPTQ